MGLLDTAIGSALSRTILFYSFGTGRLGFLQLDATVSETHSREASITENEIEDGSTVADNVILRNEKFTIEGIISEAPLKSKDVRDLALTVQNKGFSILSKGVGAISGGIIPNAGAIAKRITAVIQLEGFWKNKVPFTVITGLKKYDNVIVTKLTIPVDYKDGLSLRFTAECESVRLVKSGVFKLSELKSKAGAASVQDLGKKAAKAASDVASKKASILFNIFS